MSKHDRRRFLKVLGGAGAGAAAAMGGPLLRAFADSPTTSNEFFIFIMAVGGWDVTLWSDPRNEAVGLVNPATTDLADTVAIPYPDLWTPQALDADSTTFKIIEPGGNSPFKFGPGIGGLLDFQDRLCLINGISMNTVSHPDGRAFSATGRHLAGGHPAASSIDTMIANELGVDQLLPNVSILFPSSFVGAHLDPRAQPILVDGVGTLSKSLSRSSLYETSAERDMVSAALIEEAKDLSAISNDPSATDALALQYGALKSMLSPAVQPTFDANKLTTLWPDLFTWPGGYKPKFQASAATNAAFAVQAMSLNPPLVRCVSFALQGFDTHNSNYKQHLGALQEGLTVIANLIKVLDKTPHPLITSDKLSDHTHIMVVSDFCRTPQINLAGGRDHYPNNSAIVISPKFKQKFLYGASDQEQVLPTDQKDFSDGPRPIGPPDLLTTFVSAFGIDPRKYLRDGEVVSSLLA